MSNDPWCHWCHTDWAVVEIEVRDIQQEETIETIRLCDMCHNRYLGPHMARASTEARRQ